VKKISIHEKDCINEIVKVLQNGGVVMHPTETCYGFAADIFDKDAIEKIYKIKGRDEKKPFSILVDSYEMGQEYGVFSDMARGLAQKYWPGPLSIVVPRTDKLPKFFNPTENFVAMRVSKDPLCIKIPYFLNRPVITTSANSYGLDPLYSCNDLSQFGDRAEMIDLIVDGGQISINKPSTIVKVEGDQIQILRRGSITVE
jgi:L-threonylcarbamoyladenylate synthase